MDLIAGPGVFTRDNISTPSQMGVPDGCSIDDSGGRKNGQLQVRGRPPRGGDVSSFLELSWSLECTLLERTLSRYDFTNLTSQDKVILTIRPQDSALFSMGTL